MSTYYEYVKTADLDEQYAMLTGMAKFSLSGAVAKAANKGKMVESLIWHLPGGAYPDSDLMQQVKDAIQALADDSSASSEA